MTYLKISLCIVSAFFLYKCKRVHAGKVMRFARFFIEHICRGLIVCTKSPAVCGVFQPWESAFTLSFLSPIHKGREKRDVFSEEQRESMCFLVITVINFKNDSLVTKYS